jgi:HSP20 family protein
MTHARNNPVYFGNLFEELFNQYPANWGKDGKSGFSSIPANIHETTDGFHVELSAPGRSKEDFKINVDNGLLTVSFEKKEETENKDYKTIRKEFSFKSFKRSFNLDDKINTAAIQAKYENGVLKLYLPKKEAAAVAPQQISIAD